MALFEPKLLVPDLATEGVVRLQYLSGVSWISHCELCFTVIRWIALTHATSALSGCIRLFGRSFTTFARVLGEAASHVPTTPYTEADSQPLKI